MKIEKFIEKLENAKEKHGNLPVKHLHPTKLGTVNVRVDVDEDEDLILLNPDVRDEQ